MYRKKNAYPIVISKEADGFYYVEIPDFNAIPVPTPLITPPNKAQMIGS